MRIELKFSSLGFTKKPFLEHEFYNIYETYYFE